MNPKIEKITLKDLQQEIKKGRTVVTKRRPRSTLQTDSFELERSMRLQRFREYYGELVYKKRGDFWVIILVGYNEEIGSFISRVSAERWAKLFLGRVM